MNISLVIGFRFDHYQFLVVKLHEDLLDVWPLNHTRLQNFNINSNISMSLGSSGHLESITLPNDPKVCSLVKVIIRNYHELAELQLRLLLRHPWFRSLFIWQVDLQSQPKESISFEKALDVYTVVHIDALVLGGSGTISRADCLFVLVETSSQITGEIFLE